MRSKPQAIRGLKLSWRTLAGTWLSHPFGPVDYPENITESTGP